ncbi:polysaccharide deacetylase family protein [Gracilibacillus caseinilyticus]|uniref:Polysaccharide deacetylase family protein n=1 Tax=Gracilibacillus caseinilyticus TaxID=2932256 RepID=A0ABY4EVW7_9BACI|nr:polysaccharide deacetylase family protein [Gracilibacillus caseinilyticus]UOQ48002.1 polysaccharide deacetylase family protein [Gracilibacillus caseinilyticus]
MLKKYITVLLFGLLLFIVACGDDQNQGNDGNGENEDQAIETGNESDNTGDDEAEDDSEQTSNQLNTDDNGSNSGDSSENTEEVEKEEEQPKEKLYKVTENWNLEPLKEGTNEKVVLLTIDDAPEEHAVKMAKTLKELNAPAVFFVNGHFLESEEGKDDLKQIYEMGFTIGNHTYNHQQLSVVNEEKQKTEILELSQLVEEITGEKPKFFRAPHGDNTDFAKQYVKEQGMLLMNWTYGYDYFEPYMDQEKLTKAMVSGEAPEIGIDYSLLKPGAILLMHDRDWTTAALKDIVTGLRDKGYEMADPETIQLPE